LFEHFTQGAQQVVVVAQEEARALEHDYIGTEHILLGVVRDGEGGAAQVLRSAGLDSSQVRAHVVRIVGRGEGAASETLPFTPQAQRALKEAEALGEQQVRPEHILLAILRDDGMAARILRDFDADSDRIRADTLRSLQTPEAGASL
jgi:ATP-dependent Clp protease ATP-binding subunit ClpC